MVQISLQLNWKGMPEKMNQAENAPTIALIILKNFRLMSCFLTKQFLSHSDIGWDSQKLTFCSASGLFIKTFIAYYTHASTILRDTPTRLHAVRYGAAQQSSQTCGRKSLTKNISTVYVNRTFTTCS